jgi:hypothetical protein
LRLSLSNTALKCEGAGLGQETGENILVGGPARTKGQNKFIVQLGKGR